MLRRVNHVTALLAGFGMLATPLQAAPPASTTASSRSALRVPIQRATATKSTSAARKLEVRDVALNEEGKLVGYLVDPQGRPLAGTPLRVSTGRKNVAHTVTNAKGAFQIAIPRGGVYLISTDKHNYAVRVWTKRTAPPSANRQALLVAGNGEVARANLSEQGLFCFGGSGPTLGPVTSILTIAGIAGGTIAIASAVRESNKKNDRVSSSP